MNAIVCGIDPGLGATGYAVLKGEPSTSSILDAGVCRGDPKASLASRLASLSGDIQGLLEEHHPDVVAVEQLYSHYNHPRTAILMGHARGVILAAAAGMGIEVRSFSATRIKRFLTGNGRASKVQVQRAVQTSLGLAKQPEPADVADAIAIALCCIAEAGRSMDSIRRAGMPKVRAQSLRKPASAISHSVRS